MPSNLLEPPVITREQIVNALCAQLRKRLRESNEKLKAERLLLSDPSETDRDQQSMHRREVSRSMAQIEANISDLNAFIIWIESQRCHKEDPLMAGNIWILQGSNERMMWIVYDPAGPKDGNEVYVTISELELQDELEMSDILTLSTNCPLYRLLEGKDIREGAEVTAGIEGNDLEIYQLTQVL